MKEKAREGSVPGKWLLRDDFDLSSRLDLNIFSDVRHESLLEVRDV